MSSKRISIKIISAIISLIFLFASITPSFASLALRPNLMSGGDRLSATAELVAGVDNTLQTKELDRDYATIAKWVAGIFNSHRLNVNVEDIITKLKKGEVVLVASRKFAEGIGYDIKTYTVVINFRIGIESVSKTIETTYLQIPYGLHRMYRDSKPSQEVLTGHIPKEIVRLVSRLLPRSKIEGLSEYPYRGVWFFETRQRNKVGLIESLKRRIFSFI